MFLYSNSPSFIYTYCYVYNQKGLLIDKLKSKLPQMALTKFPEVRNPIGSLGYEKSTYIAARYLIDGKCLSDEYVNRYSKTMTILLRARHLPRLLTQNCLFQFINTLNINNVRNIEKNSLLKKKWLETKK